MRVLKTKLRRTAGAALTAGTLLLGSLVAAPSATAVSNVWADLHYDYSCTSGGYYALTTGSAATKTIYPAAQSLRHNLYKGGNNYAHGAWLTTITAVLVQPHATVTVVSNGRTYKYDNYTNFASCQLQFNAGGEPIRLTGVTSVTIAAN